MLSLKLCQKIPGIKTQLKNLTCYTKFFCERLLRDPLNGVRIFADKTSGKECTWCDPFLGSNETFQTWWTNILHSKNIYDNEYNIETRNKKD